MRPIAFSIAACALAPLLALAAAAPSSARSRPAGQGGPARPQVAFYAPLCEKDSPYLCWRDPSDGGPGTPVLNSGYGTDLAREWGAARDYSRCNNGLVSNSQACPFTPGSGLNFTYNGDEIVVVQNQGSGYCAGLSSADGAVFYMHSCDGIGGVSELATVFVREQFSGHSRLIAVLATNNCPGCTNPPLFVTGTNHNDDQLYVAGPSTYARWTGGGL